MRRLLLLAMVVGLLGACGGSGSNKLPEALVRGTGTPALKILSPQAGDTVTAPVPVSYAVTGFQAGFALAAFPGDTSGYRADLPIAAASGTVLLDDAAFSGQRTLTFALEGSDHNLIPGSAARVSVTGVMIEAGATVTSTTAVPGAPAVTSPASNPAPTAAPSPAVPTTVITSSPVSGPPPPAAAGVALSILSPAPNDVLGASVPITYQVVGFQAGMVLAVYPAASTTGFRIDFPLSGPSGSVTLENKAFSGRRDLTFVVIASDGSVSSPVTVPNVVIQGGK